MEVPVLPDLVYLAVPGFIVAILLELLIGWRTGRARYEPRDTLTSLLMGVGSLVEGVVFGFLGIVTLAAFYTLAPFKLAEQSWGWSPWVFAVVLLVDDLRYYWFHRCSHEIRWFWASHVNHHSSQHYNLSTALRQTWSFNLALGFVFRIPLVLLGVHPVMLVFTEGISLLYQFWIHTELIDRLPRPLEAVLNTPSHHRVHHATNPDYLDANYAGILIIWDRMLGTYVPERIEEPPQYGLVKNLGTFSLLRVAFHEWIAMFTDVVRPGLRPMQRLGYVFGPPGWSHDGSRETSADLKAAHRARQEQP
ncbi:MAG: sterol desaturase/sphingolipid hydroxylase (fatty acid hydroxylase superfamily) [Myxococcota bacterium]|jgi:sterol desaturase/sphingolipid hydroxylase (fatty acid hydroxylase superfamily)